MDGLARQLQEYKDNLTSSLWACDSAVKELTHKLSEQSEKEKPSSPTPTNVSAIKSQPFSVQGRGYRWCTPCATLWFFLCDQGKDTRKWDGEPTWRLEARVQELQGKTIAKKHLSRKITAPVSVGQSRRADCTFDPDEGTSVLQLQKSSNEDSD